ncbi:hypothetical protein BH20ACT19_BH20ACT19_00340 [soil metagenome]
MTSNRDEPAFLVIGMGWLYALHARSSRAFTNASTALLDEAEHIDPGLASRLREPVRELAIASRERRSAPREGGRSR